MRFDRDRPVGKLLDRESAADEPTVGSHVETEKAR